MFHTAPTLDVKSPFSPDAALRDEVVDVSELAGLLVPGGVTRVWVTAALWDLAGALPFRSIGRVTHEDRLRETGRRALSAFARARAHLCEGFEEALDLSFAIDFVVELPESADDRRYRFARLHCARTADGELLLTIGFPDEFPTPTGWR